MTNEYCPKCHELTNMIVTTIEKEDSNKGVKIITNSYLCNKCNTFVRSEDKKIPIECE